MVQVAMLTKLMVMTLSCSSDILQWFMINFHFNYHIIAFYEKRVSRDGRVEKRCTNNGRDIVCNRQDAPYILLSLLYILFQVTGFL